ncbi:unnamed protein product [Hydatigera taeniaeformis]|uniref:B box-type domain-containing protein n=1 Tax=Hydatigena taeniaeformis TaxID=6205 RepID=A0A0R3WND2_HYDTA|nr:unnamed protein product [Hydatigera taeniaeformis]
MGESWKHAGESTEELHSEKSRLCFSTAGNHGESAHVLVKRSFSIISSSTTEVNVAKLPTAQSSGRGRFRNVTRRPYRRTIDLSLSSSGVSDVDELVDQRRKVIDKHRRVNNKCSQDAERTKLQPNNPTTITSCNRDCRQCKRRQTRLGKQLSATSTDLGISTSDIDDDILKSTHNTPPECSTSDSEMDEADEDTLTGGGMKTKLGRRRSTLYSRMEAHHCRMCCDIDAQTSECEFCGLALCDVCCRLHFNTHAADVKSRLERLRNQAVVSTSKEVRHQLMLEIDKAALDLTIACNTALDRALDVYRATASVSTSFIGSLVDRRIKLSNSLKYLLRQIPRILLSDDVYELMYFVKVAKSVHERMEELKIAIGDPRSKEVFKLVLTNPFSSFAPLFEQNSLLLPLDNCDKLQDGCEMSLPTRLTRLKGVAVNSGFFNNAEPRSVSVIAAARGRFIIVIAERGREEEEEEEEEED